MNEKTTVPDQPIDRRLVVSGLALAGMTAFLPGAANAQTSVPAAVRIVALSRLKRDYDTAEFEFDGIASLLVRLPAASSDTTRTVAVRFAGKTYFLAAFTRVCTHLGCTPALPSAETHQMVCPCHGSTYGADGTVVKGPARRSLSAVSLEIRGIDVYAVALAGS